MADLKSAAGCAILLHVQLIGLLNVLTPVCTALGLQSEMATAHVGAAISSALTLALENAPHLRILVRSSDATMDAENAYVRWFLRHSPCPLTVGLYDAEQLLALRQLGENRDSFVIVTSAQRLQAVAERLVHRAGVFFYVLTDAVVEEALRHTWHSVWTQYYVYENYVLTRGNISIYDPFEYDSVRREYGKMVRFAGTQPLRHMLFRDMRGYPLRIQIFRSVYARPVVDAQTKKLLHVEGADWKVAQLLQQQMNFSMNLQYPNPNYFGERDVNGTYNGAIGSIIRNEIDACFTGFFIKDYWVPELEFTVAVYDDQLCIYVHKADRIPQSILPMYAVRSDLWFGFILTAFICAGIWCAMRSLNLWLMAANAENSVYRKKKLRMQFANIFVDTWVVWVRVNIVRYPPFSSERVFIASLCLVSVIFGAIFESSLATVYIHPMYYKDIYTMRELDRSGLKVIYKYSSMADDLFFSETSPIYASLNKKLTHLDNLDADVTLDVSQNGGKAGVSRYSSLKLESFHFILSKKVWVIPQCPKHYTISYILPKDAPWSERMNELLLTFLNAGLIKKWIAEMQTAVDIQIMMDHAVQSDVTFKELTVNNLQLAFYVILVGNSSASIIFLGELFLESIYKAFSLN